MGNAVQDAIDAGGDRPGQGAQSQAGYDPSFTEEFFLGTAKDKHVPASAIPVTSGVQDAALNDLLLYLSKTLGGVDPGIGAFTGELPGPTNLQAASLSGLERIAAGESGVFAATENDAAIQALMEIVNRGPESFTDYFETGVADPAQRDLERALAENNAAAVGSGNLFGSARETGARNTTEDFFRNMSEERARFGLSTLGQSTEDALAALGLLPEFVGADAELNLALGEGLFGIGSAERAEEAEGVKFEQMEFARQQQFLMGILELLLRGGTAPTYGVAGGFDLGQPSSSGGGFFDGLFG